MKKYIYENTKKKKKYKKGNKGKRKQSPENRPMNEIYWNESYLLPP